MKNHQYFLSILGLFVMALISCSAIKQSKLSPDEELKKALLNGTNYVANGLTFNDDIDFVQTFSKSNNTSIHVISELRFINCTFKGRISWTDQENRKIQFTKDVMFEDCIFDKEVIINDAVFRSVLQLGNCIFRKSLDLQRNTYILNCRIDENEVGQDIILQYSKFHENLSLFSNTIGNHVLLQSISVYGKSQLSNTNINGSIDISNAHFHEDFNMDYAKGGKKILGGNTKFSSRCFIRHIDKFTSIDFSGSHFFGKYVFTSNTPSIKPNLEKAEFLISKD